MSNVKKEMNPSHHQHPDISKAVIEDFAGICYDMDDGTWTQCYALEESGEIRSNETYLTKKKDAHGGRETSEDNVNSFASKFVDGIVKSWVGY